MANILSVAWECPVGGYGGLGTFVAGILPGLANLGHNVTHICLYSGYPPSLPQALVRDYQSDSGGSVWVYRVSDIMLSKGNAVALLSALKLARGVDLLYGQDLVIAHDIHGALFVSASRELGIKSIYYIHLPFNSLIEADAARSASSVATNSNLMKGIVDKMYNISSRVVYPTIPRNLVPLGEYGKALVGGDYVLLFMRYQKYKMENPIETIREIMRIVERHKLKFVMIGRGLDADSLGVKDEGLRKKFEEAYRGEVNDFAKSIYLADAKLVVYPASFEPFGLIPLEAIGLDTPVLVSSSAGVSEVLPKEFVADLREFPQRLDEILSNRKRLEELKQLAAETRRKMRGWTDVARELVGGVI